MSRNTHHRITVTGDPGSGKSTFARAVAEKTGYKLVTTGNMFRALAAKKGISVTELNELAEKQSAIDREVDDYLRGLNDEKDHLVLDSRMAWHFVRDALKIRLAVDLDVAVERIFNDRETALREKFPDPETARDEVHRRRVSEIQRYHTLYGVNIGDDANFDLVINTSYLSPAEIMAQFDEAFRQYQLRMALPGAASG
jgi:cytidylate kinase